MGRPKRVSLEKFAEYDKLHTKKTKMHCGVEQTTLYPIKETNEFYQSIEVWAYCASKFRIKKKGFKLNVDIPVIADEKTIKFLDEHCWADWVERQIKDKESDMIEAIALLDKIFPKHEKVFFYELDSLLSTYSHGSFISFDDAGNIKPRNENDIKRIKYYLSKYKQDEARENKEVAKRREKWLKCKGSEKEKDRLLSEYKDFERDWIYKNANVTDIFIEIGKNSVCYPVAFSDGTAEWAIEKYGKPMAYSNAGEIFFVVTKDKVFFEVTRHF